MNLLSTARKTRIGRLVWYFPAPPNILPRKKFTRSSDPSISPVSIMEWKTHFFHEQVYRYFNNAKFSRVK